MLAHELGEHVVDLVGGGGVELAGRLVGEEHLRAVGERGAQRDPLLLAAGELRRPARSLVGQPDALEQLVGAPKPFGARGAAEAELHRDQVAGGELGRECSGVVLVCVAEQGRAVAGEAARGQLAEIVPVHAHDPG